MLKVLQQPENRTTFRMEKSILFRGIPLLIPNDSYLLEDTFLPRNLEIFEQ